VKTKNGGSDLNGLALCAGVGGIELGLKIALPEYRCVGYVERETYPAAILVSRMAEGILDEAPIWDDIETFDSRPYRKKVDIISAGFPCQPWSYAGSKRGTDDDRWLWPAIAKVIRAVRPRYVFLENVPGILAGGLDPVLSDLAQIRYDAIWGVFSAAGVGAPHLRKRVFILAVDRMFFPNSNIQGFGPIHSAKIGCRELRPSEGINSPTDRWDVADPGSCGLGEEQQQISSGKSDIIRGGPGPGSDTNSNGRIRERLHLRRRRPQQASALSSRCGKGMAHTDGISSNRDWREERWQKPTDSGWWEVEPDVGRVADGVAYRVDRIRACGNGVVPAVAARAFTELFRRFVKEVEI